MGKISTKYRFGNRVAPAYELLNSGATAKTVGAGPRSDSTRRGIEDRSTGAQDDSRNPFVVWQLLLDIVEQPAGVGRFGKTRQLFSRNCPVRADRNNKNITSSALEFPVSDCYNVSFPVP